MNLYMKYILFLFLFCVSSIYGMPRLEELIGSPDAKVSEQILFSCELCGVSTDCLQEYFLHLRAHKNEQNSDISEPSHNLQGETRKKRKLNKGSSLQSANSALEQNVPGEDKTYGCKSCQRFFKRKCDLSRHAKKCCTPAVSAPQKELPEVLILELSENSRRQEAIEKLKQLLSLENLSYDYLMKSLYEIKAYRTASWLMKTEIETFNCLYQTINGVGLDCGDTDMQPVFKLLIADMLSALGVSVEHVA